MDTAETDEAKGWRTEETNGNVLQFRSAGMPHPPLLTATG